MPHSLTSTGTVYSIRQNNKSFMPAFAKYRQHRTTPPALRRFPLVLIILSLATPAFAQPLLPECKTPVDQTWFAAHKEGLRSDSQRGVFQNAVAQLLNPIATRTCFSNQAEAAGFRIPRVEIPSVLTAEQARRRIEDATAAYIALAQCFPIAAQRADLIGSLVSATSRQGFENRFASVYPGYVSKVMSCESFIRYLTTPPIRGVASEFGRAHSHLLDIAFLSAPASPCRVAPGVPCTVTHGIPLALMLANTVKGASIVDALMQLETSSAPTQPITPAAGAQNIQVAIVTPGKYLLTVLLNEVKPAVPDQSVSLAESCSSKTDIVYFLDSTSKLGQVELDVQ